MTRRTAVAAAAFVLLTVSMRFDPLGIGRVSLDHYEADSEDQVVMRAVATATDGAGSYGGFLVRRPAFWHVEKPQAYLSAPGLQGWLFAAWYAIFPGTLPQALEAAWWLSSAATAALFAGVVWWAGGELGLASAVALAASLLVSPWPVILGRNLYWLLALMVAPLAWGLVAFRRVSFRAFLGGVAVLLFARALCGMEFVTNIGAGAAVGPIFYALLDGLAVRGVVRRVLAVGLASIAGVAGALSVLLAQLAVHLGGFAAAVHYVGGRFTERTVAAPPLPDWATGKNLGYQLLNEGLALGRPVPIVALLCAGVLLAAIGARNRDRATRASAVTLLFAIAAAFSWPLLFPGHLPTNYRFVAILFYLPAIPLTFAFGARIIATARTGTARA